MLSAALIFTCASIAVIVFLFVSRILKNIATRSARSYKDKFQRSLNTLIVNEVYSEQNPVSAFEFQLAELRRIMGNSRLAMQTMVDQLVSMKKSLSGASVTVIEKTYAELGLAKFSQRKLRRLSWYRKAQGIRELTEMGDHSVIPTVRKYLSSRSAGLKEECLMALVRLERPITLSFMSNYHGELSRWLAMNIYHHLAKIDLRLLPDFTQWFASPNTSIVLFSIDMVKQFRRTSAIDKLVLLLDRPEEPVVSAALETLGILEAYTAADALCGKCDGFRKSDNLSKKLVYAIGRIAHERRHRDAILSFIDHPSYSVRFEVIKAMNTLGEEGKGELRLVNQASNGIYANIMSHVEEPLLT